jgi:deoxyribonuclease IV
MKIFLGPSGSPKSTTLEGLIETKRLGLHAMELSFTHGVRMSNALALQIGEANKSLGLKLSIHAPYYINLCSADTKIREASRQRILDTCERAHHMGAKKVVFHPAYYGKMEKKEVFDIVEKAVADIMQTIKRNKWDVELAPETTGRLSQFGTLEETLELARRTKCSFCVDIAHIYARAMGKIDYEHVFDKLLKFRELHFHFEGIEINKGGEGRHLVITKNKPDFREFAKNLLESRKDATVISESPITWEDSLRMKEILEVMGYNFDIC